MIGLITVNIFVMIYRFKKYWISSTWPWFLPGLFLLLSSTTIFICMVPTAIFGCTFRSIKIVTSVWYHNRSPQQGPLQSLKRTFPRAQILISHSRGFCLFIFPLSYSDYRTKHYHLCQRYRSLPFLAQPDKLSRSTAGQALCIPLGRYKPAAASFIRCARRNIPAPYLLLYFFWLCF